MNRHEIDLEDYENIIHIAEDEWRTELEEKGKHIFVSSHEILGTLTEEYSEFKIAVQSNDIEEIEKELKDVLVIALHGLASIRSNKMDWPKKK